MNIKWTRIIRTDLQIASWFSTETCVVGAQKNHLNDRVLSSTKKMLTLGRLKKMHLKMLFA